MYNGLAKGSFLSASLVFNTLQSDSGPPSRPDGLSLGSCCAPLCAPFSAQRSAICQSSSRCFY